MDYVLIVPEAHFVKVMEGARKEGVPLDEILVEAKLGEPRQGAGIQPKPVSVTWIKEGFNGH